MSKVSARIAVLRAKFELGAKANMQGESDALGCDIQCLVSKIMEQLDMNSCSLQTHRASGSNY